MREASGGVGGFSIAGGNNTLRFVGSRVCREFGNIIWFESSSCINSWFLISMLRWELKFYRRVFAQYKEFVQGGALATSSNSPFWVNFFLIRAIRNLFSSFFPGENLSWQFYKRFVQNKQREKGSGQFNILVLFCPLSCIQYYSYTSMYV